MKISNTLLYLFALSLYSSGLFSCPNCAGKVERKSPPFFSDEFYQPSPNNLDFDVTEFDNELLNTNNEKKE